MHTITKQEYQQARQAHWNRVAGEKRARTWSRYYHDRLQAIYAHQVPPGQRILEIGCGEGDLLAALRPARGVGIDFSEEMIRIAAARHPQCTFLLGDAHELELGEQFDVIILSDILNDLWDVQVVLSRLVPLVTPSTRLIVNSYSRVWELPLRLAQILGLARPRLRQNWLTVPDIKGLLQLVGFEPIRSWPEILLPLRIPWLTPLCNKILARLWPFAYLALTNFIVARPAPGPPPVEAPRVSIIIAARNEAGNISNIFRRMPRLGAQTEVVFVEGGSSDNTYEEIEKQIREFPDLPCQLFRQQGTGKGDAVRLGFEKARGEILMILDADLTVPPEMLARFYEALLSGKGEFINGVRLVYPMEDEAMRYLNFLGNKFFSLAFSWLLQQPIKDTLCGTKVLWKKDYQKIRDNRAYFGDFDPFGDFDLLFGAAKLNLKIIEIPIRYARRTYGDTNIDRWRHGLLLLKMTLFAIRKIKFI